MATGDHAERVLLAHGSGGRLTQTLVKEIFLPFLDNEILRELNDAAALTLEKALLAFTTDSFVVSPRWFPGGDIGKLAVCGTVNDLVVSGARPEFISLAMIAEEGFLLSELKDVVKSIAHTAKSLKVKIVTGDFKVVEKGSCDGLFINTSGVGKIVSPYPLHPCLIKPTDKIILTGDIGRHGLAILGSRKGLELELGIKSDCAGLSPLILPLFEKKLNIRCMRDPTRGGLATTLAEISQASGWGIEVEEDSLPISPRVQAACELLGIEPWYLACEGRAVIIAAKEDACEIVEILRQNPLGKKARIIGQVTHKHKGKVVLFTSVGSQRVLEMLTSDPLPRIC